MRTKNQKFNWYTNRADTFAVIQTICARRGGGGGQHVVGRGEHHIDGGLRAVASKSKTRIGGVKRLGILMIRRVQIGILLQWHIIIIIAIIIIIVMRFSSFKT